MDFNRRGFLITLAGGGFAMLSSEALAGAPDRYKRLIDFANELRLAGERFRADITKITGEEPIVHTPKIGDRAAYLHEWTEQDHIQHDATRQSYSKWDSRRAEAIHILADQRYAIVAQADHLMLWTMENFNGPANDGTREQIKALFERRLKIDLMDEAQLRTIEDPLINCVLVRTMISEWRLPLDIQRMTAFQPFAQRYRELFMA